MLVQVMQRDVILAIEAGLQDRGLGNLQVCSKGNLF